MKKLLPTHALSALGIAVSSFAFAQNYQTMPIQSGLTADVIANGVGPSLNSTTNDVDGVSYAFVSMDYQATSSSTALTYGLPVNQTLNSVVTSTPGLSYTLANYSGNNSLRLASQNDSGTITFTTPKAAFNLYMLSTSGSGSATVTIVVNFTDNTSQTFTNITISDWYNNTGFAVQGFGRIKRTDDSLESGSGTNPRLYQTALAIDAANASKPIQSVTITKTSTAQGYPNIFAFSVDAYSDCVPPVLQTPASITASSALVSWTAATNAVSYDIYHSTTNTIPASNATPTYTGISTTSKTIDGLTSNTNYYYWVRSNCSSATSQSAWSFGGTFKTACSTFTVPYTENFDTTSTGSSTNNNAPSCWAYLETSGFAGYGYVIASNPYSSPNSFYLYNSSATTGNQMLVSPPTTNLSDGTKRVRFYAKSSSAGYSVQVGTLTDPSDLSTFTALNTITLSTTQTQYYVNLPYGGGSQLAFRHNLGGTYRGIYIDNISVENSPSCAESVGLATTTIGANSVGLTWTDVGATPTNNYDIYYATSNTPPTSSTVLNASNSVTAITTSTTVPSLSNLYTYYFWVRTNCSSSQSEWSGPVSAITTYCRPGSTNQSSWISSFTSTGAATNMNYSSTTAVSGTGGYQNLAATSNTIIADAGATIPLSVTVGGPTCGIAIWVDWDNDGTFSTTERMFNTTGYVTTTTGTITIPAGTAFGNYRMRIMCDYNTQAPSNPCATPTRGEFLDFTLQVAAQLATAETSLNEKNIKIAPNPFKDIINISEFKDIKTIKVTDIAGRTLKTIENPEQQINLGELNAGLYLLNIQFKDGSQKTAKVIKK